MRFLIVVVALCCAVCETLTAQNYQYNYTKPLSEVLDDISKRFNITVTFREDQVAGRMVDYSPWKIRRDAARSLSNVLSPFGLSCYNVYGTDSYKITGYEYYRWSVDEGVEFLESLRQNIKDLPTWEKRAEELRSHILEALRLDGVNDRWSRSGFMMRWQEFDGYKISRRASEVLRGFHICYTVYMPVEVGEDELLPVVLCPTGHWEGGRYREDHQKLCASLARMGAIAVSYDAFASGEGLLQFDASDHRRDMAMTFQIMQARKILDGIFYMNNADKERVAITGGSGGGTHAVMLAALDERIKAVVPVVSLSCHFFGGCPCESGMPVHIRDGAVFTNNIEIAALIAPRPMMIVSSGTDWTCTTPEVEYPYLMDVYSLFGDSSLHNIRNTHFEEGTHDYGLSKRESVYNFFSEFWGLDSEKVTNGGVTDESFCTLLSEEELRSFGPNGFLLPDDALKNFDELMEVFEEFRKYGAEGLLIDEEQG